MSYNPALAQAQAQLNAANEIIAKQADMIRDLQAQAAPWFRMHRAAEALQRDPEIGQRLRKFMDWWGLDAYTPPPDVERNVRDLVHAFLLAAAGEREAGDAEGGR